MTKILHIVASPRGESSLTKRLGNAIIDRIKKIIPNAVVNERILSDYPYPHLQEVHISGFFAPEENRTPDQIAAIKTSDKAISELQAADIVVIGVPMYNFSITSGLKAYFDHIARARVTFRYNENGSEGLLKNKKAYIAVASAGIFSEGKNEPFDFATPYVKHFLGFIGIKDVTVFRLEGTAIPGMQEKEMNKTLHSIAVHDFENAIAKSGELQNGNIISRELSSSYSENLSKTKV